MSRITIETGTLPAIEAEWTALADRLGSPVWLRPAWFAAWWAAFAGPGERLRVLVARRSAEVVGLAPIRRHAGAAGRAVFSAPTNYHTPAFELLATDGPAREELVAAILRLPGRRVDLRFVPEACETSTELLAVAGAAGIRTIARVVERSPTLDTTGPWTEYHRGLRSRLRSELRRRRRRLEELGPLELTIRGEGETLAPDELEQLLAEGFEVEASGWKGERGTAIASDARTRKFYRAIATAAAEAGGLRLAYLRSAGRTIAFDFALEHDRTTYLLKTGYLDALRRFGPGMLLREAALQRAFEGDVRRFEFLGHDDAWKSEWTDATSNQLLIQAFRPTPAGLADWLLFAVGRPLAKRVVAARHLGPRLATRIPFRDAAAGAAAGTSRS